MCSEEEEFIEVNLHEICIILCAETDSTLDELPEIEENEDED